MDSADYSADTCADGSRRKVKYSSKQKPGWRKSRSAKHAGKWTKTVCAPKTHGDPSPRLMQLGAMWRQACATVHGPSHVPRRGTAHHTAVKARYEMLKKQVQKHKL